MAEVAGKTWDATTILKFHLKVKLRHFKYFLDFEENRKLKGFAYETERRAFGSFCAYKE